MPLRAMSLKGTAIIPRIMVCFVTTQLPNFLTLNWTYFEVILSVVTS